MIDIVLPAHNEEESIEKTLTDVYAVAINASLDMRLIVCEDGSTDRTVEVIESLKDRLPILLISAPERKGYSRAVVDGLREATAEYVALMDSDGQADPAALPRMVAEIDDVDAVVAYRNPRLDRLIRRINSAAFGFIYRRMFPVRLRDPSFGFHVIRSGPLKKILEGNVPILPNGFWWEYFARAQALGLKIKEVQVTHKARRHGGTRVYRPIRVPRIAWVHLLGLFRLKRELRAATPRD